VTAGPGASLGVFILIMEEPAVRPDQVLRVASAHGQAPGDEATCHDPREGIPRPASAGRDARLPLTRRDQRCRVDLNHADAAGRKQLVQSLDMDKNPRLFRTEHRGELAR